VALLLGLLCVREVAADDNVFELFGTLNIAYDWRNKSLAGKAATLQEFTGPLAPLRGPRWRLDRCGRGVSLSAGCDYS